MNEMMSSAVGISGREVTVHSSGIVGIIVCGSSGGGGTTVQEYSNRPIMPKPTLIADCIFSEIVETSMENVISKSHTIDLPWKLLPLRRPILLIQRTFSKILLGCIHCTKMCITLFLMSDWALDTTL